MGRSKKYITQEEREEADKRDKRKCYHKHKEYYNLLSKRAYYNKCLSLHPDKVEHYQRLFFIPLKSNDGTTNLQAIHRVT